MFRVPRTVQGLPVGCANLLPLSCTSSPAIGVQDPGAQKHFPWTQAHRWALTSWTDLRSSVSPQGSCIEHSTVLATAPRWQHYHTGPWNGGSILFVYGLSALESLNYDLSGTGRHTQRAVTRAHFSVGEKSAYFFVCVNMNMILLKNQFLIGIKLQNKSYKNLIYLNPLDVWNDHIFKHKIQILSSFFFTVNCCSWWWPHTALHQHFVWTSSDGDTD